MNKPTRRKSSLGWGYEDIDCPQCEICNNRPQLSWCVLCESCEEHIYPLMEDFKKHFPEYYADIDNHSSVMDWMHGVDGKVIDEEFGNYTPDIEEVIGFVWDYLSELEEE